VDVLIAPHHGSTASNTESFAAWAKPRFVVVSEGRERGKRVNPYEAVGAELWRTSREGAVLIRLNQTGIQAEGFKSRRRWQSP
jgi:beta-lactamase superfamily II metal-dependent hydrolase